MERLTKEAFREYLLNSWKNEERHWIEETSRLRKTLVFAAREMESHGLLQQQKIIIDALVNGTPVND